MKANGENALARLGEGRWTGVGRETAKVYAGDENWLFRRVESIEFVDRRSVRRTVTVDFEVPRDLKKLKKLGPKGHELGPKDTFLIPIAMVQKWPATMDFHLVDAHGSSLSRYRGTTTKQLDFGLLLGMIDRALGGPKKGKGKETKLSRVSVGLLRQLAEVVEDPQPSQADVTKVVNRLNEELEDRRPASANPGRAKRTTDRIAAAIDLAARLSGGSILWVAVPGPHRADRIVKFSYQGAHLIKSPRFAEDKKHQRRRMNPGQFVATTWKRVATSCSWRGRTLVIPLLHGGQNVRYHLDISAPAGSVEMYEATAVTLPAAKPPGYRAYKPKSLSVATLAAKYHKVLSAPDEWVGPESNGYFMDYGKPKVLASTESVNPAGGECDRPADASAEIIDRQAHVYSGADGAPSHRVLLQLKLKGSREGLVSGCLFAAAVIATLMCGLYLRLSEAAHHLEVTVVLLSVVPVVLGYVVVRPDEQPFEHEHLRGVRLIALLSGALPIAGAFCLLLTQTQAGDRRPDLSFAEPAWMGLAIASLVVLLLLGFSWFRSASPKRPTEPTPGNRH